MSEPIDTREYLTLSEAAEQAGVDRATLWRWHRQGLLHLEKVVGVRSTLVHRIDLEEALEHRPHRGRPRKDLEDFEADGEERLR